MERFFTYGFVGTPPSPIEHYQATSRVTPIVDGDRAFVEWSATFDCAADEYDHWTMFFENSFAKWLGSLRAHLAMEASTASQMQ